MQGSEPVITFLNEALTAELTSISRTQKYAKIGDGKV